MKLGTALAALVFTSAAVALAVWFGQPAGDRPTAAGPVFKTAGDDWPVISPTGPHPRAVALETEHDFGTMLPHQEGSHTFVIRNEGDAPLELAVGTHTCKCTLSELAQRSIPPGEEGKVTLTWHPESQQAHFSESAEIRTNDPENRAIRFSIHGAVEDLLRVMPPETWHAGEVSASEPATVKGVIMSAHLDEFAIVECRGESEHITAEATPLEPADLAEAGAKSGYMIQATIQPSGPLGRFTEQILIRTDVREGTEHKIYVSGHRQGPVHFVPLRGARWFAEVVAADLGRVPAAEGTQAVLLMFVTVPEGLEFAVDEVQSSTEYLQVSLDRTPDSQASNRARFRLTLTVPPGLPPLTAIGKNAASVTLKTNHPQIPELTIRVRLVTYGNS